MYITHRHPAHLSNMPRSFASLMELYEKNYIAFRCLCPQLPSEGELIISSPAGAPRLYLKLLERARYTSSVELTHYFDVQPEEDAQSPSLCVRIYHDARQAEVLLNQKVGNTRRTSPFFQKPDIGELRIRWSANRFLNRWLNYCLGQGYGFADKEHLLS